MEAGAISAVLSERSRSVAFLVTNVMLATGLITFVFAFIDALSVSDPAQRTQLILQSVAVLVITLFLRFYLFKRSYRLTFIVLSGLMLAIVLLVMLQIGTASTISYIIFFVSLLTTIIVLGVRYALIHGLLFGFATLAITLSHRSGLVDYVPSTTESGFVFTFVSLVFVAMFIVVAYLGYRQIEYAFDRAFEYGEELEQLNANLDKQVQLRTQQLANTMEHQKLSMHNDVILGRLSRAMVHDLATPVSALGGTIKLLQEYTEELPEEIQELLEVADGSVDQVTRIIRHSRDLLRGGDALEKFSPAEIIDTSLLIVRRDAEQKGITVTQDLDSDVKMFGSAAMFERIVINIIMNAIEELQASTLRRAKRIKITGYREADNFILIVEDNGRGISPEISKRIFEENYSTKQSSSHLGFGLSFARESIKTYFGGDINVDSVVGKCTRFRLNFNLKAPLHHHDSDRAHQSLRIS